MYASAASSARRAAGSRLRSGSGTRPVTGADIPGLVPKVMVGSSAEASISIAASNRASGSLRSVRQRASAASQARPFGARGLPCRYSNVVSSGATRPARAPASMDMLQRVIRASIESARMASPEYSSTCPVPPETPSREMISSTRSLAVTQGPSRPLHPDLHGPRPPLEQALRGQDVSHLAGPDAEGERAECAVGAGVAVAADHGASGLGEPELGPDDVNDALVVPAQGVQLDAGTRGSSAPAPPAGSGTAGR